MTDAFTGTEIAIIGVAGRFPGASNPQVFWENLTKGIDASTALTEVDFEAAGIPSTTYHHPDFVKRVMCLEDIAGFDPGFFGIAPGEAALLDPQQRLLLEVAWEALENAGYSAEKTDAMISVFAGCGTSHYDKHLLSNRAVLHQFGAFQIGLSVNHTHLATRIAYKLNLKGPAVTVATACSTALSATHLACQSLLNSESDIALAGGVSLKIPQKGGYLYHKDGILSNDGRCRAFDVSATGTAGGNGASMVTLKRLEDALEDRDHIYAMIKGTALNNDGNAKVGFTAPSVEGQAAVIAEALSMADVDPKEISYVETHGTGTALGDPIEIAALSRAFGDLGGDHRFCAIGSVKTNVGHMDTASGTTGLIKVALMLYHEQMPASLHFTKPNPLLKLHETPFYVNTALKPWPKGLLPRRAGVSSFGVGGTNAHIILEEAPQPQPKNHAQRPFPLLLSANTNQALSEMKANLANHLSPSLPLGDVAYTLALGRHDFSFRSHVIAADIPSAQEALSQPLQGPVNRAFDAPKVVFMFSGQGGEYISMSSALYQQSLFFKAEVDRLSQFAQPLLGCAISDSIIGKGTFKGLAHKNATLFVLSFSIAKLWQYWGIEPHALVGLSLGEYVAACFSGVLGPQQALALIIGRAELVQNLPEGKMLSIATEPQSLSLPEGVDLAIISAPDLCVVSGPPKVVDALAITLSARGIDCREVAMDRAFHSHMVDVLEAEMLTLCAPLQHKRPKTPYLSNVTGTWITPDDLSDPAYWFKHLRQTMQFASCLAELASNQARTLLEIGPGDTLRALAKRQMPDGDGWLLVTSVPHKEHRQDAYSFFLDAAARLWAAGHPVRWERIFAEGSYGRVPLPTYPFQRKPYWVEPDNHPQTISASNTWYYQQSWEMVPEEIEPVRAENSLVVGGSRELVKTLQSNGQHIVQTTVESRDEMHQLFAKEGPFDRIIFVCPSPLASAFDPWLEQGFYPLSNIISAHRAHQPEKTSTLIVLTCGAQDISGEETFTPFAAMISTLLKVIPQENNHLVCRHIDLPTRYAGQLHLMGSVLSRELDAKAWSVALRGHKRWGQKFVPMHLNTQSQAKRDLRKHGTYLITGGLGRIGLFLAQTLAQHYQAQLALLTRRNFPPHHQWQALRQDPTYGSVISSLLDMERAGGKVSIHTADIADPIIMHELVKEIQVTYGPIHGVFHAAAETRDTVKLTPITHTQPQQLQRQLQAKVEGTRVLLEVFDGIPLDFGLCFSSNAAVLGRTGLSAYASANAVMDALIQQRAQTPGSTWISATWDGWHLSGTKLENTALESSLIDATRGAQALVELIRFAPAGQVIVSREPLGARVDQWLLGKKIANAISAPPIAVDCARQTVQAQTPMQENMVTLWSQILGLSGIGIHDHFFELGGHSLMGTQLMSRLRDRYQVHLPIKALYDFPTIAQLAAHLEQEMAQSSGIQYSGIAPGPSRGESQPPSYWLTLLQQAEGQFGPWPEHDLNQLTPKQWLLLRKLARKKALAGPRFPLSFSQERLWFLHCLDPKGTQYHVPLAARLKGPLNVNLLNEALNQLLAQQECFRTHISQDSGTPFQVIESFLPRPLSVVDLQHLNESMREAKARELIVHEAGKPFDLAQEPFFRFGLLRLGRNDHWFYLTQHHIVTDGWSVGIFLGGLARYYQSGRALPPPALQYADFAQWQRSWLRDEVYAEHREYWVNQLRDGNYVLHLPWDKPRPPVMTHVGGHVGQVIDRQTLAGIKAMSQAQEVSLFMAVLTAFSLVLNRYSDQQAIHIGTAIAGRNHSELEEIIGCFINTLVLALDCKGDATLGTYLQHVRNITLDAYAHQDFPFEALVKELQPQRQSVYPPLCQVMFTLQNAPETSFSLPLLHVEPMQADLETVRFDLSLNGIERSDGLALSLQFNCDLFTAETVKDMLTFLCHLLTVFPDHLNTRLKNLPLCEPQAEVLYGPAVEPCPLTVYSRAFEQRVYLNPDSVALEIGNKTVTYAQLNQRANGIASLLKQRGLQPEQCVGLLLPREGDMVAGILAVFKAGGVYVPMDYRLPQERLAWMAADSAIKWVLTKSLTTPLARGLQLDPLCLDDPNIQGNDATHFPLEQQAAYIIYTSGSSGKPKGVIISQGSLLQHCLAVGMVKGHHQQSRILHFASFNFDVSLGQLLPGLLKGATLILPEGDLWPPEKLLAQIDLAQLTHLHLTPAYWQALIHTMEEGPVPTGKHLTRLDVGGDVLPLSALKQWQQGPLGHVPVFNGYGPTETVITATIYPCAYYRGEGSLPLGDGLPGRSMMILSRNGEPCPTGIPGELTIGGQQLARGYLGKPGTTAERFIPDGFARAPGARCYRSGDLVRRNHHGEILFLGRIDHQVKIRGFRIELGEIEKVLQGNKHITRAAVVLVQNGREPAIMAYAEARQYGAEVHGAVLAYLQKQLPDYMIPHHLELLPELPVNVNGKIDRKALSLLKPQLLEQHHPYTDPVQELVASFFVKLLHIPSPPPNANFFSLGGHSLLAMRLISLIRQNLQVELPLTSLFDNPTPSGLALAISQVGVALPLPPVTHDPTLLAAPLSLAQRRLWFMEQLMPGSNLYHMPMPMLLEGPLCLLALEEALNALVARHDALRTRFCGSQDAPQQIVAPVAKQALPVLDLTHQVHRVQACLHAENLRPFNLQTGPLFRVYLLRLSERKVLLYLNMHHLISDGWSVDVLTRELMVAYKAFLLEVPNPFPKLTLTYRDYVIWQEQHLRGEVLDRQLHYWVKRFQVVPPPLALPMDGEAPAVLGQEGASHAFLLDAQTFEALKSRCMEQGCTLYMTLLAVYVVLLHRYSNQADLVVGTPIANRQQAETENMIGLFANTLALRCHLRAGDSFETLLKQIRTTVLEAHTHQDLPFEQLVAALDLERSTAHSPLFQTMFTFAARTDLHRQADPMLPQLRPFGMTVDRAKFELTLAIVERPDSLACSFEYNLGLMQAANVKRMAQHFGNLAKTLATQSHLLLDQVHCLTEEERHQLLATGNGSPPQKFQPTFPDMFQAIVRKQAGDTAIVDGDNHRTYAQLDERTSQIAHELRMRGVRPGCVVGIHLTRSCLWLEATIAVLKSGAAYLPLDPEYPTGRLAYMLEDANAQLLLTQSHLEASLDVCPQWCLDQWEPGTCPTHEADAFDLHTAAYLIYTSGSTGNPKGVVISHGAMANHIAGITAAYGLGPADRVLQMCSTSFDLSVEEIFPTLAGGARLVLAPTARNLEVANVIQFLDYHGITVLNLPTALWQAWIEAMEDGALIWPESLRLQVVGTDAASPAILARWRRKTGNRIPWINAYGPTEGTVTATYFRLDPDSANLARLPIGRAISGVQTYILDDALQLLPMFARGGLYIGGAGLARGYHNHPARTAESFLPDSFSQVPGARMYRTGDIAMWQSEPGPAPQLHFIGRQDRQVKVRGFRVEPGEIETRLCAAPGVVEAVVAAFHTKAGDRLIAYLRCNGAATDHIPGYLSQYLAAYMIPEQFIVMDQFPMTPSGKIDRRALRAPDAVAVSYNKPRNVWEQNIARIFTKLLDCEQVDIFTDFFALGGHSLLAIKLVAMIEQECGLNISLASLFQRATVAQLAQLAQEGYHETTSSLVSLRKTDTGPSLFLFPPLQGMSLCYKPLVAKLPHGNIWGLQSPGIDGTKAPLDRLEALSDFFAQVIEDAKPQQPIQLAGWSMGGVLAIKTAQKLHGRLSIQGIVLIDSFAPQKLSSGSYQAALALEVSKHSQTLIPHPPLTRAQLDQQPEGTQLQWVLDYLASFASDSRIGLITNIAHVCEANNRALMSERIEPYDGPVYLVEANAKAMEGRAASTWEHLLSNLSTTSYEGDHFQWSTEKNMNLVREAFLASLK